MRKRIAKSEAILAEATVMQAGSMRVEDSAGR